jgi:hypothetical protein
MHTWHFTCQPETERAVFEVAKVMQSAVSAVTTWEFDGAPNA